MKNPEYVRAIENSLKNVSDITEPDVLGLDSRVLIAQTPKQKIVCKFDDESMCRRDRYVSNIIRRAGIKMPEMKIYENKGRYFTAYKYNPNKTLAEWIDLGLPRELAYDIYCDAFDTIYKISQIPVPPQKSTPNMFASDQDFMFHQLLGTSVALYHNDLHSGNILVTDDFHFDGLIDVSAITLTTTNMFLARAWIKYPAINFEDVLQYWGKISGTIMDEKRIADIRTITETRGKIR
ncbi:MAG: hypothetical protein J6S80_02110 [Alphaproteobacteria bacterium]|nr:hypothetical protein [Alphaproteobacteria bacterium]